jgi:two-component system sensor kinase FixL
MPGSPLESAGAHGLDAHEKTVRLASLGQLVAEVLQDLSAPLNSARHDLEACVRLIDAQPAAPAELSRTAVRALANVTRAADLLRRVRGFIRLEVASAAPAWLNEVVRAAVAQCTAEMRSRGINLRLDLAENLPPIRLDPDHMQQAVVHLIFNAFESMTRTPPDQREVLIRTAPGGPAMVEVIVRDRGCGLPAELGEKIFDPYITTRPHGLGLGLYLSRKIVAAHGGRLWGRSVPSGGAEFRIELPIGSEPPVGAGGGPGA